MLLKNIFKVFILLIGSNGMESSEEKFNAYLYDHVNRIRTFSSSFQDHELNHIQQHITS